MSTRALLVLCTTTVCVWPWQLVCTCIVHDLSTFAKFQPHPRATEYSNGIWHIYVLNMFLEVWDSSRFQQPVMPTFFSNYFGSLQYAKRRRTSETSIEEFEVLQYAYLLLHIGMRSQGSSRRSSCINTHVNCGIFGSGWLLRAESDPAYLRTYSFMYGIGSHYDFHPPTCICRNINNIPPIASICKRTHVWSVQFSFIWGMDMLPVYHKFMFRKQSDEIHTCRITGNGSLFSKFA